MAHIVFGLRNLAPSFPCSQIPGIVKLQQSSRQSRGFTK
jgi:hypothetical protein